MKVNAWLMAVLGTIATLSLEARSYSDEPPARVVVVKIKHLTFNPRMVGANKYVSEPVKIRVGDSVQWVNEDGPYVHTVRADDDSFATGYLKPGQKSEPIVFVRESGPAGFGYSCEIHDEMKGQVIVSGAAPVAPPGYAPAFVPPADHPGQMPMQHSMFVAGSNPSAFYLHHVAVFTDTNHTYQVLLVAALDDPANQQAFKNHCTGKDQKGSDQKCLINPDDFVLAELHTKDRKEITATFGSSFSDSFSDLTSVKVRIVRVIQFRSFHDNDPRPDRLVYQLFGDANEVFMTHQMTQPPDFQEVVALKKPSFLTAELLEKSPLVKLLSRQFSPSVDVKLKSARLDDGSHFVLSTPASTNKAGNVLSAGDELDILIGNDKTPQHVTVDRMIWFDAVNLNGTIDLKHTVNAKETANLKDTVNLKNTVNSVRRHHHKR